jgi:uncharacterized membrane protein
VADGTDTLPSIEGPIEGPFYGPLPQEAWPEEPHVNWVDRRIDDIFRWFETPDGWPFTILSFLSAVWIIRFSQLVMYRNDRYGSFDFDAGIYNQAGWLFSRGSQFDTVRGLPLYAHHVSPGFYLFAPFYWLGIDGQTLLNVSQVVALGVIPFIAYWIGKRLGLEPWIACAAGVVCVLNFSSTWLAWELFHPEVFAIAPLFAAYGFALKNQWKPYWVMLFLAIIWKEDLALAIIGLGIVLLIQKRDRKVAFWTIGLAAVWFLVATQVILPHFSPTGNAFYAEGFYGDLGGNFTEILKTSISHPSRVQTHLSNAHAFGRTRDLWSSVGFVNLLAPETIIIAVPQFFANFLSVQGFTWELKYHYVAIPLIATLLGMVIGLSRVRGSWRGFAAGVALVAALATGLAWGVGPFEKNFDKGYWPLNPHPNQQELDHAVSLVPKDASVSASYHMVPHLSERHLIFSFPNPWKAKNWGIGDKNQRSPNDVDWIVAMKGDLGADDQAVLSGVLADTNTWHVVYDTPAVVVAKRNT